MACYTDQGKSKLGDIPGGRVFQRQCPGFPESLRGQRIGEYLIQQQEADSTQIQISYH